MYNNTEIATEKDWGLDQLEVSLLLYMQASEDRRWDRLPLDWKAIRGGKQNLTVESPGTICRWWW